MNMLPPQSLISAATLRWLIEEVQSLKAEVATLKAERPQPQEQDPPDEEDLIELPVAAARFDISKNALEKACRRGVTGVKPQGRWMISARWLKANRHRFR